MQLTKNSGLGRVDIFEALRGIMALWVVIGHVLLSFNTPGLEQHFLFGRIFEDNAKAVDVFIILSGFVIFHLLANKPEKYQDYLFRRFMRLFPAYLVCLVISAVMLPISIEATAAFVTETPRNAGRLAYLTDSLHNFWYHFVMHLTMLHGLVPSRFLPNTDYAILGQAWSISVEWQFYVLAPLAFALCKQGKPWVGVACLVVLMLVLLGLRKYLGDGYIGAHLLYFAIGAVSSRYWMGRSDWHRPIAKYSNIAIPVLTLLWCLIQPQHWHIAIWFCVFLAALSQRYNEGSGGGGVAGLISGLLSARIFRWLGRISYSVYLVHMIPLLGMLWLLRGSDLSQEAMMLATLGATLLVTFVASTIMYQWIELPFIEFARRRLKLGIFSIEKVGSA